MNRAMKRLIQCMDGYCASIMALTGCVLISSRKKEHSKLTAPGYVIDSSTIIKEISTVTHLIARRNGLLWDNFQYVVDPKNVQRPRKYQRVRSRVPKCRYSPRIAGYVLIQHREHHVDAAKGKSSFERVRCGHGRSCNYRVKTAPRC